LGRAGVEGLLWGGSSRAEAPIAGTVPHDDRAGRQVAGWLVAAVQQHHEEAGEDRQEWEKAVHQPHQVAHHRRGGRYGMAGLHDDPDPERLLAGRAAAIQRLEQGEIAKEREDVEKDQQRTRTPSEGRGRPGKRPAHEGDQDHSPHDERGVEQRRGGARTHSCELEVQLNVLGRLDPQLLAQVGRSRAVSRGCAHVPILLLDPDLSECMTDIKPMQLGEILDGALTIFGRNLRLFMALGIIALAGPLIYFAFLSGPLSRAFVPLAEQMRVGVQPSLAQWQPVFPLMGLLLVGLMFYYIASYFLAAGTMRIISDTYLGRRPQLGDAVSLGASKMLPLVGVALCKVALLTLVWVGCVIAVVVLAGLMGLVGPRAAALGTFAGFGGAVWVVAFVMCGYGVTAQVLTLEDGVGVFGA